MEYLIALLIGLLAYLITYDLLYRSQLRLSESEKRVNAAYDAESILREANPKSPEYKLAAAGIRTNALAQANDITDLSPTVSSTISSNLLSVTVSATFTPVIPWPSLPNQVPLRRTAIMRILN